MTSLTAKKHESRQYLSTFWESLNQAKQEQQHPNAPKSQAEQTLEGLLPALMRLTKQGHGQAQYYLAKYLEYSNSPFADVHLKGAASLGYVNANFDLALSSLACEDYSSAEQYAIAVLTSGDKFLTDELTTSLLSNTDALTKMPKLEPMLTMSKTHCKGVVTQESSALVNVMRAGGTLFTPNTTSPVEVPSVANAL